MKPSGIEHLMLKGFMKATIDFLLGFESLFLSDFVL
jgi:hypothetical protein